MCVCVCVLTHTQEVASLPLTASATKCSTPRHSGIHKSTSPTASGYGLESPSPGGCAFAGKGP